jgi:hypothetical protein
VSERLILERNLFGDEDWYGTGVATFATPTPKDAVEWLLWRGFAVPPDLSALEDELDLVQSLMRSNQQAQLFGDEASTPTEPAPLSPPEPTITPTEEPPPDQPSEARAEPLGIPEPAEDPTAYRPAKEFLDGERYPDYKAIHRALDENSWIRWRNPSPRRLEIHAGDWHKFRHQPSKSADPLDAPADVVDAVMAVESRKAQEHSRKAGS